MVPSSLALKLILFIEKAVSSTNNVICANPYHQISLTCFFCRHVAEAWLRIAGALPRDRGLYFATVKRVRHSTVSLRVCKSCFVYSIEFKECLMPSLGCI